MTLIRKIIDLYRSIKSIKEDNREILLLIGSLLAKNSINSTSLKESEFRVFSQFGDDGIIQFLINRIKPSIDKFVEFGVENYEESNTRFLLMYNNWKGLVIDASNVNIDYIKKDSIYWRYDLTAVNAFITPENVNEILKENNFIGKIGLLSIDIDGNDYWAWKAITISVADIVIIEYNSLLGMERAITVPYQPHFSRALEHYSHLYFGASLPALCDLGKLKGYAFVGCNQAGNNAYFVKENLLDSISVQSIEDGFVAARFREARDTQGRLTFAGEDIRSKEIIGLPVINTRTGLKEVI